MTGNPVFDIMKELRRQHKRHHTDLASKEGQRVFLRSSKRRGRCPSLDNYPNPNEMGEEAAMRYLADILAGSMLGPD